MANNQAGAQQTGTAKTASKWTADSANKAKENHEYLYVGGNQVTPRFLSGAKVKWQSDDPAKNELIYNSANRITGLPNDVGQAMMAAGATQAQAQQIINSSYSRNNILDNPDPQAVQQYMEELQAYETFKKNRQTVQERTWGEIVWFADHIREAIVIGGAGSSGGTQRLSGKVGNNKGSKDEGLIGRLRTAQSKNQYLDVSQMKQDGAAAKTTQAPKTSRGGKFGILGIPIISNSMDNYMAALQSALSEQDINNMQQQLNMLQQYINYANLRPQERASVQQPPAVDYIFPQLSTSAGKNNNRQTITATAPRGTAQTFSQQPQSFMAPQIQGFAPQQQQQTFTQQQPQQTFTQQPQQQQTFTQQLQPQQQTFAQQPQQPTFGALRQLGSPRAGTLLQ